MLYIINLKIDWKMKTIKNKRTRDENDLILCACMHLYIFLIEIYNYRDVKDISFARNYI